VQSRFETASCECIVRQCVGAKQLFLYAIFYGHQRDEVGVINVKYARLDVTGKRVVS
jgi:hypothetical protein